MLATEAHQVRLQALAAHAEAAVQIEHANNAGRGLSQYELDLHGLHATEAVDALDRRSAMPPCDCACSVLMSPANFCLLCRRMCARALIKV